MSATALCTEAIANEFLERSGRDGLAMTPMKLLKLVYIAHGWNLAVTGLPLFEDKVQAWQYGPVVPSLFHEFKEFGRKAIKKLAHTFEFDEREPSQLRVDAPFVPKTELDTIRLLDWSWGRYGKMSGPKLSELTHEAGTPWWEAREAMKKQNLAEGRLEDYWMKGYVIENVTIRKHYVDLWNKHKRNDYSI